MGLVRFFRTTSVDWLWKDSWKRRNDKNSSSQFKVRSGAPPESICLPTPPVDHHRTLELLFTSRLSGLPGTITRAKALIVDI